MALTEPTAFLAFQRSGQGMLIIDKAIAASSIQNQRLSTVKNNIFLLAAPLMNTYLKFSAPCFPEIRNGKL